MIPALLTGAGEEDAAQPISKRQESGMVPLCIRSCSIYVILNILVVITYHLHNV